LSYLNLEVTYYKHFIISERTDTQEKSSEFLLDYDTSKKVKQSRYRPRVAQRVPGS